MKQPTYPHTALTSFALNLFNRIYVAYLREFSVHIVYEVRSDNFQESIYMIDFKHAFILRLSARVSASRGAVQRVRRPSPAIGFLFPCYLGLCVSMCAFSPVCLVACWSLWIQNISHKKKTREKDKWCCDLVISPLSHSRKVRPTSAKARNNSNGGWAWKNGD